MKWDEYQRPMAMVIGFLIPMEHYKLPLKRDERVTNEQIPRELLKGAKFKFQVVLLLQIPLHDTSPPDLVHNA